MKWSYKAVHFELKKEGILGSGFLDESEIEQELNEYGRSGWELVSALEVHDGMIAFFKQPFGLKAGTLENEPEYEEQPDSLPDDVEQEPDEPDGVEQISAEPEEGKSDTDNSGIGAIRIE